MSIGTWIESYEYVGEDSNLELLRGKEACCRLDTTDVHRLFFEVTDVLEPVCTPNDHAVRSCTVSCRATVTTRQSMNRLNPVVGFTLTLVWFDWKSHSGKPMRGFEPPTSPLQVGCMTGSRLPNPCSTGTWRVASVVCRPPHEIV